MALFGHGVVKPMFIANIKVANLVRFADRALLMCHPRAFLETVSLTTNSDRETRFQINLIFRIDIVKEKF